MPVMRSIKNKCDSIVCRVNSFCGCVKLDKFATFLGNLGAVSNSIAAFLCASDYIRLLFRGDSYISDPLLGWSLCVLGVLIFMGLVKGVKTRDPRMIQMFRVPCCLAIISGALAVLLLLVRTFVMEDDQKRFRSGIAALVTFLALLWLIYVFICINSLYKNIEDELLQRYIAQPNSVNVSESNVAIDNSL